MLKARQIMIVTDPGVIQAGLLKPVEQSLNNAGLAWKVFDQVESDPRIEVVEKGLRWAKSHQSDLIIGLGGVAPWIQRKWFR